MSEQTFQEALIVQTADGSALSNSTTPTSILHSAAKVTLPANFFTKVGKMLRIRAAGRLSNIVTTPGTLTFDVRFGGTVVFNGGAVQMSTTAHTNLPFELEMLLTCRAIGSSANLIGQGRVFGQQFVVSGADPTGGHGMILIPNTAPAVGNNFDSSAAQVLDLFAAFSIANAGNALTLHQFVVESLN